MYARPLRARECVCALRSGVTRHNTRAAATAPRATTATCVARLGLRLYVSRMLVTLRGVNNTTDDTAPRNQQISGARTVSQPTSSPALTRVQWCT